MALVDLTKVGLYCEIHGRLQKSVIDNPDKPNSGVHAYPNLPNGVYKYYRSDGKKYQICCTYNPPHNNKTVNQLAWQTVYRAGIVEWNSFTQFQKDVYIRKAYGKHWTGYNHFMKEYLLSH
jgi:hypothetical protein